MFLGHYAVALAAKKVAPKTSLGTLFLAGQLVDLLWPLFLLLGIETVRIEPGNTIVTPLDFNDYPITHSLLMAVVWSLVFALGYYSLRKYPRGTLVTGICVFSHWVLDFVAHRPDLPLAPGSETMFGLSLWNSLAGTIAVEFGLFAIGVLVYLRATNTMGKVGTYGFWGLIVLLIAIYVANLLGPPPPSAEMIAVAGNSSWLFVLWAYWVDRNRTVTTSTG